MNPSDNPMPRGNKNPSASPMPGGNMNLSAITLCVREHMNPSANPQGSTGDDFSAGAGDRCSYWGRGREDRANHEKRCICVSAAIMRIIKTYDLLDYNRNVNTSFFHDLHDLPVPGE